MARTPQQEWWDINHGGWGARDRSDSRVPCVEIELESGTSAKPARMHQWQAREPLDDATAGSNWHRRHAVDDKHTHCTSVPCPSWNDRTAKVGNDSGGLTIRVPKAGATSTRIVTRKSSVTQQSAVRNLLISLKLLAPTTGRSQVNPELHIGQLVDLLLQRPDLRMFPPSRGPPSPTRSATWRSLNCPFHAKISSPCACDLPKKACAVITHCGNRRSAIKTVLTVTRLNPRVPSLPKNYTVNSKTIDVCNFFAYITVAISAEIHVWVWCSGRVCVCLCSMLSGSDFKGVRLR